MLIAGMAGICVAAIIAAVAMHFRSSGDSVMHNRLDMLAGKKPQGGDEATVLTRPLDDMPNAIEEFVSNFFNLRRLLDQADIKMPAEKFFAMCGLFGGAGFLIALLTRIHFTMYFVLPLMFAPLPLLWAVFKRKSRMKKFTKQLPEALDMVGRALRAGHSLGAGLQMVSAEIPAPLGTEFGRVYEEQNLGIALEESLRAMCDRVPSLDLRFFSTAVILQRTTGGDLAEILEKISHIIRERFKIFGQIQALTGEGRLSGIVLLAMPPALMVFMFMFNHDYIMMLFNTDVGNQMLAVATFMQLLGAVVIKKIINIKV